eukprot:gb/GFBE01009203.1/.p1 GENE.gb/GFBE01009203.1/~~gb/GFBE01009203.1/.p1  ORF type:complete len:484 (+),score=88.79 gb/GFBE01009203.1/:1-1452(+)
MKSAAVVALVGLSAPCVSVQVPVPGCTCISLGKTPDADGMVNTVSMGKYPADYGSQCGAQQEPGSSSCTNLTTGNPLPADQQASWCPSPWCWVDPCTCDLSDLAVTNITTTTYFDDVARYYSYSNCGGQDSYSSTVGNTGNSMTPTCPNGEFDPEGDCVQKMDNEAEKITCTDPWAVGGKCVQPPNMTKTYPANYGEGCRVHPEPGNSDCSNADGTPKAPADQAAWCTKPWSYVNPCTCTASDMARSTYFYPKLLFYSTSACGAADLFTSAEMKSNDTADAGCPSPPPPAAMQNPPRFPRSKPVSQQCQCIDVTTVAPEVDCDKPYAQGGKCINVTKINALYPKNYGSTCGVQLEPTDSNCFDVSTGNPWAAPCRYGFEKSCRKLYCDQPWCYVDPCSCSDVQADDITKTTYFDAELYYSFANCAGSDSFTSTPVTPDRSSCTSTTASSTTSERQGTTNSAPAIGAPVAMVFLPMFQILAAQP